MSLYEQDYYQWTIEQANLLRAGALSQLDIENLIEEVESMGRSEKRELVHRLTVLITHLLKWDYQPEHRGRSWENTIRIQRIDIRQVLKSSPGLKNQFEDAVVSAYEKAVIFAADETGLPESAFPETCPYAIKQIMGE
jgi:hypothetical protein